MTATDGSGSGPAELAAETENSGHAQRHRLSKFTRFFLDVVMTLKRLLGYSVLLSVVVAVLLTGQQPIFAQQDEPSASHAPDSEYYYPPVTQEQKFSIAQQKAIARGKNRLARLETQRRHGLVPGRPDATVLPWMSATSLTWTRPKAGLFVYNSGYYRPYYYYSYPYGYPYTVRR